MMFITFIPEEEDFQPRPKRVNKILTEAQYFSRDVDKLKGLECPACGEQELFRGCVFIGCRSCLNYFVEADIISKNIG